MTDLKQAAHQALEALEQFSEISDFTPAMAVHAITALRAALAEPEQNPFGDDAGRYARKLREEREAYKALFTERKPEQEPDGISWLKRDSGYFTAPTPRKPLTDEEMRECAQAMNAEPLAEGWPELIKFARAIERAHGIGEQT